MNHTLTSEVGVALKAVIGELDFAINNPLTNPLTAWDLARAREIIRLARAAALAEDTREGLDPSTRAR